MLDALSSGPNGPRAQQRSQLVRELEELRPGLNRIKAEVSELSEAAVEKRQAVEALAAQRQAAAEQLGSMNRRQLSEIRQLCRSPPENVKRTLAAAWLLLNAGKFRGKPASSVQFEDGKDWSKCQKMLGDDSFISRILEFDTAGLIGLPQVMSHVAVTYLGQTVKAPGQGPGQQQLLDCSRPTTASEQAPGEPPVQVDQPVTPVKFQMASRASFRRTSTVAALKAKSLPPVPLELAAVTRASEPCGRLLLWMQRLLFEVVERARLESELALLEAKLHAAEQKLAQEEMATAKAEAALGALATPRQVVAPLPERPATPRWSSIPVAAVQQPHSPRKPLMSALLAPLAKAPSKPPDMPEEKPPVPIELDVTGQLSSLQVQLIKLRTSFGKGQAELTRSGAGEGSDGVTNLPRLVELLREYRDGRLKLLLEGHRAHGERDGTDLERAQAVMQWLVDEGVSPGLLRSTGAGTQFNDGAGGRHVVPVALRELVPLYGPITPEAAAARAPVGLYFEARSAQPGVEAVAILQAMASWLKAEKALGEVLIEGHCDRFEAQATQLSQQRAKAALDLLVREGVCPKLLQATGLGSRHPLSLQNRASNRRVEVHLRPRARDQ